ncbi:MAG: sulfatase-like hydrolase/transferase [Bacteroidota bacterium]|nr:sulfatase-like hydrolase/transferase [Bacteroidota bacterium]
MTRPFRVSLTAFGALLLLYTLLRLGFYVVNGAYYTDVSAVEVFRAFVRGVRFDAAGILLLNVPVLLLYLLPGEPSRLRWYRAFVFGLFLLLNVTAIALNLADYAYYPMVQRRLLYEPYTMLPDLWRMAPATLSRYRFLALGFAVLSVLFALGMSRLLRAVERRQAAPRALWKEILTLALAAVLVVIGIRGGLQLKPLRQSNAFVSPVPALGYLTLNSTYTVLRTLFQPALPAYDFLPQAEAQAEVRTLLASCGEMFPDTAYTFLRKRAPADGERRLNVVIIIMESWTTVYNGCISGKRTITPFFDSLARGGLLFSNFMANGQRSIEAVPSILASIPGLYHASLIGSKAEMNNIRGLGTILRERGYTTSFHHGATTGSMGFDAFARLAGFFHYYGKESYPSPADSLFDHVWGLNDEPFFLDAVEKISALPRPFCSVLFSLSSHIPFEVPRHRHPLFEAYKEDDAFERSLRYSDFALGRFFHSAREKPWFDSTVFLITADHTIFGARNTVHSYYHIPLLIYAPSFIRPGREDRIGSHVDILPTILDLLGIPAFHASMGRSLLDPDRVPFAVERNGPEYCIFDDSLLYVHDLENEKGLFRYRENPKTACDVRAVYLEHAARLRRMLFSYLQTVTHALADNRIVPPDLVRYMNHRR